MNRQIALLEHALGAMRRRGRRNLAIVLGLAALVALWSATVFLAESLRLEYRALISGLPDLTVQRLIAGRPALVAENEIHAIESLDLPGVRAIHSRVWGYLYVSPLEGNIVVMGLGDSQNPELIDGDWPRHDDEIVIGTAIARMLGLRVGDQISLRPPAERTSLALIVSGILDPRTAALGSDFVMTTQTRARSLLGVPSEMATDLVIELTREEEANVVSTAIADHIEGARVIDRRLVARTYELTFDTRAGFVGIALLPALLAAMLLAWERWTGLGENERREIGILKATGFSTADVLALRMWESGLVAFSGAVIGIVVAYVHVFVMGAPGLRDALFGWSSLHADLTLAPAFDITQALTIIGAVVLPFIAISVVPAWRAAMVDPDRLLRGSV
jgi:ABC-type lipoprotein release transport system permease subunit